MSFKYTDVASGSSDSISLDLSDRDRHWIGGWFPRKGDALKPVIVLHNWDKENDETKRSCGKFIIDDFSFKGGPPIRLTIDALALPSTSGFKATERTYTYENSTIKEIGEQIAKRAGLKLVYDAPLRAIETVSQDKQTDCSFLNDLVVKYGLALKIYNDRLVIFDEAVYESKAPVVTLRESDFEPGWSWNTKLTGTYTGVKYQYTHTKKDKTFTVNAGSGERILICDDEANNQTEATIIALAKFNNANKGTTTMKITMRTPGKNIISSNCVQIEGLGNLDGKYYVDEATTTISDGTKTAYDLRKVEKRIVMQGDKPVIADNTPENETKKSSGQYSVGDKVRVQQGATTYDGRKLASFVYTTVYVVTQVGGKNLPADRIVISEQSGGVIAAVAADKLYRA